MDSFFFYFQVMKWNGIGMGGIIYILQTFLSTEQLDREGGGGGGGGGWLYMYICWCRCFI